MTSWLLTAGSTATSMPNSPAGSLVNSRQMAGGTVTPSRTSWIWSAESSATFTLKPVSPLSFITVALYTCLFARSRELSQLRCREHHSQLGLELSWDRRRGRGRLHPSRRNLPLSGHDPLTTFKVSRGYHDSASGNHRMTTYCQGLGFRTSQDQMEGRPTRSERTTPPHSVVDLPQLQTPVTKCDVPTKSMNCPENFFHALITPDCQIFPPYHRTREFSVNITSCNLQGCWNIAPPL